jgi:glycine/D-amino acid oxidase-like deaminating enzyme
MPGPPSLWQVQSPWEGFPPLDGDSAADVVVVGAGVTGCACALRLARGGASVLVLEAHRVAAGASGRNGGFASAGTAIGLDDAARAVGMSAAVALHRATEAALDEMLALAAGRGDAEAVRRTGSLWLATSAEADGMAAALTALVAAGVDCREAPELIPAPMRARYPHAAVFPGDCELHPARWVRALAGAVAETGAQLREHSPASAIERCGDGWRVATPKGAATGRAVVVASDGLLPQLVPELRGIVYPVRGQMLATEPLPDPVITMPTHCDHGFVYARPTLDGRLAIGGCRSADLEAEYTDEEGPTPRVQEALDRFKSPRGSGSPAFRSATAGRAPWASRPT